VPPVKAIVHQSTLACPFACGFALIAWAALSDLGAASSLRGVGAADASLLTCGFLSTVIGLVFAPSDHAGANINIAASASM
jgi:hypothetical protein